MKLGTVHAHVPVHAAVAHDDVAGPQPAAQLRRYGQQPHARGAARCIRTGRRALGPDKRGDQSVKFIQGIERPQELQDKGMNIKFNMFSGNKSFY